MPLPMAAFWLKLGRWVVAAHGWPAEPKRFCHQSFYWASLLTLAPLWRVGCLEGMGTSNLFKCRWSKLNGNSEMCGAYFCLWKSLPVGREFNTCPLAFTMGVVWENLRSSHDGILLQGLSKGGLSRESAHLISDSWIQGPRIWPSRLTATLRRVQRHLTPLSLMAASDGQMWYFDLKTDVEVKLHADIKISKEKLPKGTESHQQLEGTRHRLSRVI